MHKARAFFFVCAGLVLLACPTATRAEAAVAPDSARITFVRVELRHSDDVRIVTGGAKILTHHPGVSSDGLRLHGDTGISGITSWTLRQERLVPWAEIESIDARTGASHTSILLGAVAGLAVGLVIAMGDALSSAYTLRSTKHAGAPVLLGIVGGIGLGILVDRPGPWQSVYP